jgi:hypothetical protein
MPHSSLSTTAKTAIAMWLAQSPPPPNGGASDPGALCARLARSAKQLARR